jgi:hypothetical protein
MNNKLSLAKFGIIFIVIWLIVIGYNRAEGTDRFLEAVKIGEKWGFKDALTGKIIIKPQFNDVHFHFGEGLAGVCIGGKWGFINETGKIVIKPRFVFVSGFSERLASVNIGGKLMTINGRRCTETYCIKGGKWGFIDRTGKTVIDIQFDDASDFKEGLAPVKLNNKCGYIDRKGKLVIDLQFELAFEFTEGLAAVRVEKKFGYIDKTGKLVINPQFDMTLSFHEGLAAVKAGDKWGYIDKTGKMIIKPQFDFASSFFGERAGVRIGNNEVSLDRRGKIVEGEKGYVYVGESKNVFYYYNLMSKTHLPGEITRVWIKKVPGEIGLPRKGYENYEHSKELVEIDCSEKRLRFVSLIHYDTDGKIIDSISRISEWHYIVPGSIEDAFYESLCP